MQAFTIGQLAEALSTLTPSEKVGAYHAVCDDDCDRLMRIAKAALKRQQKTDQKEAA